MAERNSAAERVETIPCGTRFCLPRHGDRREGFVDFEGPMSSIDNPDRFSANAVAGIGPVSIRTGSAPLTTAVCTRAIGVIPSAFARSDVVISNAAAPSEI